MTRLHIEAARRLAARNSSTEGRNFSIFRIVESKACQSLVEDNSSSCRRRSGLGGVNISSPFITVVDVMSQASLLGPSLDLTDGLTMAVVDDVGFLGFLWPTVGRRLSVGVSTASLVDGPADVASPEV